MSPNNVSEGDQLKRAGLISELLRGRRWMQNNGGRFRAVFPPSHLPQIVAKARKVHDDVTEPRIAPAQGDFVGVDQHELSLDRITAIVIGPDADMATERRIFVEWG